MCGIAGKVTFEGSVKSSDIKKMTDSLSHRGPDDDGVEALESCGLGQRRLAIIDLSPKGHQPMSYDSKRYWITFNGEIYNYLELRSLLLKKGYRFTSQSDTEVILAMYAQYNEKCVEYFNGMFAFAIYDKKKKTLFAARDRMGKKPFKYYFSSNTFIFASEIKALFTQPEVPKEVDEEAISSYIYWGFVPSPRTGFKAIYKLPPGHYLILQNKKLTIKPYWSVTVDPTSSLSVEEAKSQLRTLLESSVSLRMIADVPLGSFLSGGIDSCVVTGLMNKLSDHPVRTFTVGASQWGMDERADARISSQFHGTRHMELEIKPNVNEALIHRLVTAYDEPFGDSSAIPSYFVSQLARKHVTVALNGDGGDESFFAYSNHTTLAFIKRMHALSLPANLVYRLLRPFTSQAVMHPLVQRVLRVSHLLSQQSLDGYSLYARGYTNGIDMNELWNDATNQLEKELASRLPHTATDDISKVLSLDLSTILPDGLMTKMDIASMQWALEGRSPLLDYRIVEFAASLPLEYKYHNHETKWILKEACNDLIPPLIRSLPKRGFVLPVNEWMKTTLRKQFDQAFLSTNHPMFSILNFDTTKKMYDYHQRGVADYSAQLWKLFMLSKWYDTFFKST